MDYMIGIHITVIISVLLLIRLAFPRKFGNVPIWDTDIYTIRAASTMLPKVRNYINKFHIGNLTTLVLTPTDEFGRRRIWHRFTTLLRPELLGKDFITGFVRSLHEARKRILNDLDEIEREHYT